MFTVVGSGFIGSYLQSQIECQVYTRESMHRLYEVSHDIIIVAAPSSNRVWANSYPQEDLSNCQELYKNLSTCCYRCMIVISTVDVFVESSYGRNRKWFEQKLLDLPNVKIIRLPMICHPSIKKNILYDIKHECWLDKINIDSEAQYYPLDNLISDIQEVINSPQICHNLTSRPISNRFLIDNYNPKITKHIEVNSAPLAKYNVKNHNDKYSISDAMILDSIGKYFNENRY
jgi:hypothetical protein